MLENKLRKQICLVQFTSVVKITHKLKQKLWEEEGGGKTGENKKKSMYNIHEQFASGVDLQELFALTVRKRKLIIYSYTKGILAN